MNKMLWRKLGLNLSLSLASVVISFHMLEIFYRLYLYIVFGLAITDFSSDKPSEEFNKAVVSGQKRAIGHPLLHWVPNPHRPSHTDDFLRKTGEIRDPKSLVVCMGGSSTYGIKVSAKDSYPNQLQFCLNELEPPELDRSNVYPVKVLNAGVPGWAMAHLVSRYMHDIRYREPTPQLIILYTGYNDIWTTLSGGPIWPGRSESFTVFSDQKPWWMSYRTLLMASIKLQPYKHFLVSDENINYWGLKSKPDINETGIQRENLPRFKKEVELLLNMAKVDGINVLVVLQDTNAHFSSPLYEEAFILIRNELLRIAEENGAAVVDMHAITQSKVEYFSDILHMTKEGNQVRGKALSETVKKILSQKSEH
jgi:lysophospholipase L1-like esterase